MLHLRKSSISFVPRMKFSSQHIKLLAISFLLIFAFAHSAKSFHVLLSDCSHEFELASSFSDADQENSLSEMEEFKSTLDCAICNFTFQQADLAVSFQFFVTIAKFNELQPVFGSSLLTKQQVTNQSLRGPPNSIK
ncbi:MAG: hypothetical protein ACI81T_001166 [Bacteroidia bacterium]